MESYKHTPPGTKVEIAHGCFLSVEGFGLPKIDLAQPGGISKVATIYDVAYMRGLSKNLLSIRKASKTSGKPFVYYENKAVLGIPGDEFFVLPLCSRTGMFSTSEVRHAPHPKTVVAASTTRSPRVAIATRTASREIVPMHRMLAHPSDDTTRKTAEQMGVVTIGECVLPGDSEKACRALEYEQESGPTDLRPNG